MAKLSAHGKELARMVLEESVTDPNRSVSWERQTLCLMEDGTVMSKADAVFKPAGPWDPPDGRRHSWGWKNGGKTKATVDAFVSNLEKKGYKRA